MKFRTDFVTNSSSSSFLVFNVKHPKLYELLTSLGVSIKSKAKGRFDDTMEITLPTGESMALYELETEWLPATDSTCSLSAWIIAVLFGDTDAMVSLFNECEDCDEYDETDEFNIALLKLLHKNGLLATDIDNLCDMDGEEFLVALSPFNYLDKDIECADIEYNTGFEGELINAEKTIVSNGYALSVTLGQDLSYNVENLQGMHIAIVGDLGENKKVITDCITEKGAIVDTDISSKTDYLICDNLEGAGDIVDDCLAIALENCIPVISSAGFLSRFTGEPVIDEEKVMEEAFECTYGGNFIELFYKYGVGIVERRMINDKT